MTPRSMTSLRTLALCATFLGSFLFAPLSSAQDAPAVPQGTLEIVTVHGAALEGNLEGNPADRTVYVYLPPGYATNTDKRYPVMIYLHGYGVGAQIYAERVLALPGSADTAIAAGADEMIVVVPDAFTKFGGSMYSNSPTIGDWESFIARDLVAYVDGNYRTLAARESRGLAGHSMGGYGTMRIGMKYPDTFVALYAMSACCLLNNAPPLDAVTPQLERMAAGIEGYQMGTFDNALLAQAAAWAPNPQKPPYFLDLGFEGGEAQPLVQAKWTTNSQLHLVDQHVPALKQYKAIMLDVGDKDGLVTSNTELEAALTRLAIPHGWEVYDGDHGNRIGARFIGNVLPYFSEHLQE